MKDFDVVVVGAGTAGQTAASDLRAGGLRVAVVEHSDRPGGICALAGCQAKKYFYEAAETVARARHLKGKGIVSLPESSWGSVCREKNRFTAGIPAGTVDGLNKNGIAFIQGRARFVDEETMVIGNEICRARHYVLATGAGPMTLPMEGAEYLITSDAFLDLAKLPRRILFIGGGFISFEFAHFAARLGPENSRITILEAGARPLAPFDAEMVDLLTAASAEEGIDVITGAAVEKIEHRAGRLTARAGGEAHHAELMVHGAGRTPDIEDLNLASAGVTFSHRGIAVDNHMRTSNPRVLAVGDCAATIQLARVADAEAHTAAGSILQEAEGGEQPAMDYTTVPFMLFTYPQYGMVGRTENALQEAGIPYRKSFGKKLQWPTYRRIGMSHAAYKILCAEDGRILGAHFIGDNTAGLLNTIRQAMIHRETVEELHRHSVLTPYPTRESDLLYMLRPLLGASK